MSEGVKLSEAQRRCLEWLAEHGISSMHSLQTSAGVSIASVDGLQRRGLVKYEGLGAVTIHATVQQFRDERLFSLHAEITPAGRAALSPSTETQAGTK